jgi:hypothetical protein
VGEDGDQDAIDRGLVPERAHRAGAAADLAILVRADSAAYEQGSLRRLEAAGRGYAISADMRAAPRRPPRSALG